MDEERRSEIIAEMQKIVDERSPYGDDDPGLTTREWSKVWDVSIRTASVRLRDLFQEGMLEHGRKLDMRMDGTACKVPVYRAKT